MIEFDREAVSALGRKHLEDDFPLFEESHTVDARDLGEEKFWVGYRTTKGRAPRDSTHFDINVERDICYLLWIELVREERGKNHGRALYGAVENIARDLGCDRVRQTPSGWTPDGKTRKDYLKNLGYVGVKGSEEVEKVFS